jgi:hypothetical protein
VKIVCTVGLPATIVDALQMGRHAIRQSDDDALFVIFYEPWVLDIDLDDYSTGNILDPDRPRKDLHDNSLRRDRARCTIFLCKTDPGQDLPAKIFRRLSW